MTRRVLAISALAVAGLLSACGAATPATPAMPTAAPTAANTAVPIPTAMPSAAPVSLDPCALIPSDVASALAGASFGPGEEESTEGGGRMCTYGAQTANVFIVDVAQAPDVDTAKAYKAQFLADLEAKAQEMAAQGLETTEIPDFADGAVSASLNLTVGGATISGGAFGFLKGTIFVGFSDVVMGGSAPSAEALQAEAQSILDQLP